MTYTWTYTDCALNSQDYVHTVTINPIPDPIFLNPPSDTIINCSGIDSIDVIDLAYSNGETGTCEITGTVPGALSGSYDDCGGIENILQDVRELIEYPLIHPEIYKHLGVQPPRGVLLHGPPLAAL